MSKFKVLYYGSCADYINDLEKCNESLHNQLCGTIKEIIENPFRRKYKKLEETDNFKIRCPKNMELSNYKRARSGDYRIIFTVYKKTILVIKIGLRKNVYEKGIGCPKLSKKKIKSLH